MYEYVESFVIKLYGVCVLQMCTLYKIINM